MVGTFDMNLQWKFIAKSVIGHSHIRKNLPNQDAGKVQRNSSGYPLIAAIADGHGGKNYFRSDRGSGFAVHSAVNVLTNYFQEDPSLSRPRVAESICKDILKGWKLKVLEDIKENPYCSEELALIEEGKAARKFNIPMDDEYNLIRPYGSTILAAIVTEKYVSFFQLGDGDIVIHRNSESFFRPIPSDKNLAGNETYSLCMPESWRDFKVVRIDEIPDYIMLCTDGYANSFLDDSGFLTAAKDIYSYIYTSDSFESGVDLVKANLGDWLSQASKIGSGDDITAIILAQDPDTTKNKPAKFLDDDVVVLNSVSQKPASYNFLKPKIIEEEITIKPDTGNIINTPPTQSVPIYEVNSEGTPNSVSPPKKPQISHVRTGSSVLPPPKGKLKVSKKIIYLLILILAIGIVSLVFIGPALFSSPEEQPQSVQSENLTVGGDAPGSSRENFQGPSSAESTKSNDSEEERYETKRNNVENMDNSACQTRLSTSDSSIQTYHPFKDSNGEDFCISVFDTLIPTVTDISKDNVQNKDEPILKADNVDYMAKK